MQDDKDSTRKRTRPLREHGAETRDLSHPKRESYH